MIRVALWKLGVVTAGLIAAGSGLAASRLAFAADGPKAQKDAEIRTDDLAEDEIAGRVVDVKGRPIEGALVDVWTWYPGNETKTDTKGMFRLSVHSRGPDGKKLPGGFDPKDLLEIRISKDGYTPQVIEDGKSGDGDFEFVLTTTTYAQGRVTAPDGKAAANALIRAGQAAMRQGRRVGTRWYETRSGDDGRYRLYLPPDQYDVQVRVPGVGVARVEETIEADETKALDIPLRRGVAFRAKLRDDEDGKPVAGVRFWHWQHKDVEGRSDAEGNLVIEDMFPGRFDFFVESKDYARWWSEEAATEWSRRQILEDGWQRNFDSIDFDLTPGMASVTVILEKGVRVRGRVLDPDGKPVAGATVAPARTGTGNSLTGDTRFSAETDKDGRYDVLLPAGNGREYNLVAHDGSVFVWRRWANGITEAMLTKPGQAIDDLTLSLTRPATVRGTVVDGGGQPVPRARVRATPTDMMENRYFVPAAESDDQGKFELKFIRPAEQSIELEGTIGTGEVLELKPGEERADVELVARGPQ